MAAECIAEEAVAISTALRAMESDDPAERGRGGAGVGGVEVVVRGVVGTKGAGGMERGGAGLG